MEGFLKTYVIVTSVIGNIALAVFVLAIILAIYKHFKMKKIVKDYAKTLVESGFLTDAFDKMSKEEQETLKKYNSATSEVTFDFNTMTSKKKTKWIIYYTYE